MIFVIIIKIINHQSAERAEFRERRERKALSYKLLSPDRIQITWAYPSSILPVVTGCVFCNCYK